MAKVALIVGAMPENSVLAGLAVKDAPHHVVVPDLVHTDILQADARYVANPSSMCLYVVANNQRDFSLDLHQGLPFAWPRRIPVPVEQWA